MSDVLYAVHHTMGCSQPHNTWLLHSTKLGPASTSSGTSRSDQHIQTSTYLVSGCEVTYQEVKEELKNVFDVDDATYTCCLEKAKAKAVGVNTHYITTNNINLIVIL